MLSWNELRTRAAQFPREWGADAHYEKGETQSVYNDFFRRLRYQTALGGEF